MTRFVEQILEIYLKSLEGDSPILASLYLKIRGLKLKKRMNGNGFQLASSMYDFIGMQRPNPLLPMNQLSEGMIFIPPKDKWVEHPDYFSIVPGESEEQLTFFEPYTCGGGCAGLEYQTVPAIGAYWELKNYFNQVPASKKEEAIFFGGEQCGDATVLSINHGEGCTGTIVSNRGERLYNQDSAIIAPHPNYSDFRLVAVADGMGSHADSDKYSARVINSLREWFINLPVSETYTNSEEVALRLNRECIPQIRADLLRELKGIAGGTTLSGAIICDNSIVTFNIGDSRVYAYNSIDGRVMLLTQDDTPIGHIPIELRRFHPKAHYITRCLPKHEAVTIKILDRKDIEFVFACTDGVSDKLSLRQIQNIIEENFQQGDSASIGGCALALVNDAVTEEAIIDLQEFRQHTDFVPEEFYSKLPRGHDNTTIASTHIRRRERIPR